MITSSMNLILMGILLFAHSFGALFVVLNLSREMEKYRYFILQIQIFSLLFSGTVFCTGPHLVTVSGNQDISLLISYANFSLSLQWMPIITALILYFGISLLCAHVHCFVYRLKAVEAVFVERPFSHLSRSLIGLHSMTFLPLLAFLFDALSHLDMDISMIDDVPQSSNIQLPLPFPVIPITLFVVILFVYLTIIGLTIHNSIRVLSDPKMQDGKFFAHHKRALFELAAMILFPLLFTLIGTEILSKIPQIELSIVEIWSFLYSTALSTTIPFIHLAYRKKILGFLFRPIYHVFPSLKKKKRSAIQEMLRQTMTSMRPVVEMTSRNAMISLDPPAAGGRRKRNRVDSELSSTTSFS